MKIIARNVEAWEADPVPTEKTCYELLAADQIAEEITYYAIPWAPLLNNYLRLNFRAVPRSPGDAFTVCQHINYPRIIKCCRLLGINYLFTPHAVRSTPAVNGVRILPCPHFPIAGAKPAAAKDILFSFVGAVGTHWSRRLLTELEGGHIQLRDNWHFWGKSQDAARTDYAEILARSVFALCPRGTGPGTIRFWEALQAEAIPVLISDDLALPARVDWRRCLLSVPENPSEILRIPNSLKSLNPNRIAGLRANVRAVYRSHVAGEHFVKSIREWAEATTSKL